MGVRQATTLISAKRQRVAVTVKWAVAAAAVPHQRKRHQGVFVDRDLPNREGRFADSASKTTPQPANPRRTPLCHPDHHLKRKERRQVVGLLRTPFKRMAVGLGTARSRCTSGLGINPLTIASPFTVIFCRHINSVPMCWYLLNRQGRFADSASKTTPQPANPRRMPLCHPDHHFKRKERR